MSEVRNPLGDKDSGDGIEMPKLHKQRSSIAADAAMAAYNDNGQGARPQMEWFWQTFENADVEREFVRTNRQHLPFTKKILISVLLALLVYYGWSMTRISGDDEATQVYKTLVPAQLIVTTVCLLFACMLEVSCVRPHWQLCLGLTVILPILTVIVTNAIKFSKFSTFYGEDIAMLFSLNGVTEAALGSDQEAKMKILHEDKWVGTLTGTVLGALNYWQSKFLVQQP